MRQCAARSFFASLKSRVMILVMVLLIGLCTGFVLNSAANLVDKLNEFSRSSEYSYVVR